MASNKRIQQGHCEMCGRECELTFHHLIPRTCHKTKWFKKNFTRDELQKGINICRDCHDAVHKFITEKELGRNYNTLESLMEHDKVLGFVKWIKKR